MVRYRDEWRKNINVSIMQAACVNVDIPDCVTSMHIYRSSLELPIMYETETPLDSHSNPKITDKHGFHIDLWLISANAAVALQSLAQVLSAGDWHPQENSLRAQLGDCFAGLPPVCAKLAGSLEELPGSLEVWQDGIRQTLRRAWPKYLLQPDAFRQPERDSPFADLPSRDRRRDGGRRSMYRSYGGLSQFNREEHRPLPPWRVKRK